MVFYGVFGKYRYVYTTPLEVGLYEVLFGSLVLGFDLFVDSQIYINLKYYYES